MKKRITIALIVLSVSILLFYIYQLQKPHFMVYGYYKDYNRSFFLIYGHDNGESLKFVGNRYFIRLNAVPVDGIAHIRENINTTDLIHYFLNLRNDTSIYEYEAFPNHSIHYFQDTTLNDKGFEGMVSFYIGDTTNTFTSERHMAIRDSIIQSLK